MKRYDSVPRLPVAGVMVLIFGSVLGGVALGIVAYYVSDLVFLAFLYPGMVGAATMLAYNKLHQFSKVNHTVLTIFCALVMGIAVLWFYLGTPYYLMRAEFVSEAKELYGVTTYKATLVFNDILFEETGSDGLVGYFRLRAQEGDVFTNYMTLNGVPIQLFDITLKSSWRWLFWLAEGLCIVGPVVYIGFELRTRAFNNSANNWYDNIPDQVGEVLLESRLVLFEALDKFNVDELKLLLAEEDNLAHPKLELYEQRTKQRKGDVLVSVKETFYNKRSRVKRKLIGQWEASPEEFEQLRTIVAQSD